MEFTVKHVISFRRPGQIRAVTKMTIPHQENPTSYVRRLENLGYKVVDISPPLAHCGQPQNPKAQGYA
jgi:hypothetical protein